MNQETKNTKWYVVYNLLAKALFEFHAKCTKNKKDPGEELYKLLVNDSNFKKNNKWIDKFEKEFGINSLDPIHIFASFNGSKSSNLIRKDKIFIILDLLKQEHNIEDINFVGCPTPTVIHILGARNHSAQKQIWDLFRRVFRQKRYGIKQSDFKNYKNWYGIEFGSITIFLFWIESDSFLPLDANTRGFLVSSRLVQFAPKDFQTYSEILDKLESYNYKSNKIYGSRGLFREIAQISYSIKSKGINSEINSSQFLNLIKESQGALTSAEKEKQPEEVLKTIEKTTNLGFRIIAIKPLKECSTEFLNILNPGEIYYFEKAFEIYDDRITFNPEKTISLYDHSIDTQNTLKINITAIVGKNGSGKSSLLELFFRIINNITFTLKKELNTNDLLLEKGVVAELFYMITGELFCVSVNNSDVVIQNYVFQGVHFEKNIGNRRKFAKSDLENLFYTVAVNYSHYALNSKTLGPWVQRLFHKNDSYQTPLVINPMRTDGIININVENELVKSRLMANLFSPIEENGDLGIRQITEQAQAKTIYFKRILDKNKILFVRYKSNGEEEKVKFNQLKTKSTLIFPLVEKIFNIPKIKTPRSISAIRETKKYIIKKLVKISVTYSHYSKYFDADNFEFDELKLEKYLRLLKNDSSHITYKLKQAINYLKYPELLSRDDEFTIDINEYSDRLQNFFSENQEIGIIELLPPPIYKASIELVDKEGNKSDFERISSGEKQLIHSINSILYHIKYIDSVNSETDGLVGYRNINLLLDEIEMYYHPELQRNYITHLLRMISKLSLVKTDAINICLVTHSPYILSDIPDFYTLRLDKGSPVNEEFKTFGSNIHDLLANDFFMKDGFMGEWAKRKIEETIRFLNFSYLNNLLEDLYTIESTEEVKLQIADFEEQTKNLKDGLILDTKYHEKLIDLIGEPIIKNKLTDMFNDSFGKELKELIARKRIFEIAKEAGLNVDIIIKK